MQVVIVMIFVFFSILCNKQYTNIVVAWVEERLALLAFYIYIFSRGHVSF